MHKSEEVKAKIDALTKRQTEIQKELALLNNRTADNEKSRRFIESDAHFQFDFEKRVEQLRAQGKENAVEIAIQEWRNLNSEKDTLLEPLRRAFDAVVNRIDLLNRELNSVNSSIQAAQSEYTRAVKDETKQAESDAEKNRVIEQRNRLTAPHTALADAAEKIISDLQSVQIVPSTECVELNDKLTKILFSRDEEATQRLLGGRTFGIIEKRRKKKSNGKEKRPQILSPYGMQNFMGFDEYTEPLNEFDRAVLGVIISEYLAGNTFTTINIVYRALTGKVGKGHEGLYAKKDQRDAIAESIMKLMSKSLDLIKFKDSFAQMKYTDKNGNELIFKQTNLIYLQVVDAKINGNIMRDVIYFPSNSPLFAVADAKSQIIRYPHELLNVPNQNNTPLAIALKKYVLRRICEIKLHKQLAPTITFDDVFKKCRVEISKDRKAIMRRRDVILKFVEHLQEKEFIKSFEVKIKNGAIHGFSFTF